MPLPKLIAAAVCVSILGAQLSVAFPPASDRSWYWPFLPYPMYSKAHALSDTLVVPQLRAEQCEDPTHEVILDATTLGAPLHQLTGLLTTIARAPESAAADSAMGRLSRAIEAEYPARYCVAAAWARTIRVADTATYDLHSPLRRVTVWSVNRAESK
jgi:hypothetical protein